MKTLKDENQILHELIGKLGKKKSDNIGEWSYWSTLDGEKANTILREKLTKMLISGKICTEYDSKNYINKLINEKVNKMNANEVRVGKKVTIKVGKNEVEVTVIGKNERGWIVSTASGKSLSINNAERFIRSVDVEEKATNTAKKPALQTSSNDVQVVKKLSMLDAAVQVLKATSQPMSSKELIAEMEEKNLWKSPAGKTPSNTLTAAINRECGQKENPRFKKSEKGKFTLA